MYTLDQLRHWFRRFTSEPEWGIVGKKGGLRALSLRCGITDVDHFEDMFLHDPPRWEYLTRRRQRVCSRQVALIREGKLVFDQDPRKTIVRLLPVGRPPEFYEAPKPREIRMCLRNTGYGPKIHRLPPL